MIPENLTSKTVMNIITNSHDTKWDAEYEKHQIYKEHTNFDKILI